MGHLARDPVLSHPTPKSSAVDFPLVSVRRWKGRDKQMKEEVCQVDCHATGRKAQIVKQYLIKGRQVLITGRLESDNYTTPSGAWRVRHRVFVERIQFLGDKAETVTPTTVRKASPSKRPKTQPPPTYDVGVGEDLPF